MRNFRRATSGFRRRRHRYLWEHNIANNAAPNATLNTIDLLSNYRSHAGITINLPEITIWRVKLRISVVITGAAAVSSNDGVLFTTYVDSLNQAQDNPVSSPRDQHWMLWDQFYVTEYLLDTGLSGAAGTYFLERQYDIKSHRRLAAMDDTLYLQLAASGQTQIANYSYSHSTLMLVR